jgi:hypothetical protein
MVIQPEQMLFPSHLSEENDYDYVGDCLEHVKMEEKDVPAYQRTDGDVRMEENPAYQRTSGDLRMEENPAHETAQARIEDGKFTEHMKIGDYYNYY